MVSGFFVRAVLEDFSLVLRNLEVRGASRWVFCCSTIGFRCRFEFSSEVVEFSGEGDEFLDEGDEHSKREQIFSRGLKNINEANMGFPSLFILNEC